jgi:hypothetical protein
MKARSESVDGFIRWLEGRLGRPFEMWERATLMSWLQRIWLEGLQ